MVATDTRSTTGLPAAASDIGTEPQAQTVVDGGTQPTVDRGEAVALSDASVTASRAVPNSELVVVPATSAKSDVVTTAAPVPRLSQLLDSASHLYRTLTDGEYRRDLAREPHIETLQNDGLLGNKIAAASALGRLIKDIGPEEAAGSSASRAITELKIVMANPENDWRLRSTALVALRQHSEVGGEPTPAFARDLARSLVGEKQPGMRLALLEALSHSREPFVQEVLLETLKDPDSMISASAGQALQTSYGLRYSSELEGKLLSRVSGAQWMDQSGHEQEREAALGVLAVRKHRPHYEVVADIIRDASEPAGLRLKAMQHYGRIESPDIREALLDLAGQDKSSLSQPDLIDRARQLLAEKEPKLELITEGERRVRLSHYAA